MQYTYRIECESLYNTYYFVGKGWLSFIAKWFANREMRQFKRTHPNISLTIVKRTISRHSVG